ncbi:phosphodiester glycosidase family protein [Antrihabitans stalactiti]|uniref:Phosphodiester glycosidase domain-containing protein n=1 Tax=Antrihabitans stalactiti TaxID=2584121 RepID=A0A848KME5_9NOCA|nr:phosphodiester glycosidase family protein [Antrihabitans stalactiti]NMN99036.1 hypothetical protein [Antrihabitans stalactiti]
MTTPHMITTQRSARAWRTGRHWWTAAARTKSAVLLCCVVLVGVSYVHALLAPGYASWTDKTSSWIRDHGGAPLLNAYENWRYTRHPPSDVPADLSSFADPHGIPGGTAAVNIVLPLLPSSNGVPVTWRPGRLSAGGDPLTYTAVFEPDPTHRSVVAAVAIVPHRTAIAHLVAGTRQPGGEGLGGDAQVPAADVPNLLAVFNSGFKMKDIDGGFYKNGVTVGELVDGAASAVIDDHGQLAVGAWGRDLTMTAHVRAVRQNLALIVDAGRPVPGLETNRNGAWGSPRNQLQYTSRSGLGTTAAGDLVYVAGEEMNLTTLAAALTAAGAVRGMELDIHQGMTFFSNWTTDSAGTLTATKLLPTMSSPPDRYLSSDQRDFFYLTAVPESLAVAAPSAAEGTTGSRSQARPPTSGLSSDQHPNVWHA